MNEIVENKSQKGYIFESKFNTPKVCIVRFVQCAM